MAMTVLSLVMPVFSKDLPSSLLDKEMGEGESSKDGQKSGKMVDEELEEKHEELEEEGEGEGWETCSDSEFEDDEEVTDKVFHEQGSKSNDICENLEEEEEENNYLLKISPDIFLHQIRTSFVNNREADGAHWFGSQLRHAKDRGERELHRNSDSDEEDSDDESEEEVDEDEAEEDDELSSVLQSWDWPQQLLWESVMRGQEAEVMEALRSGASLTRPNPWADDLPALPLAVRAGRHEVVQLLLRGGAEPRVRSSRRGTTAVEVAAKLGNQRILSSLLEESGGDIYWLVK